MHSSYNNSYLYFCTGARFEIAWHILSLRCLRYNGCYLQSSWIDSLSLCCWAAACELQTAFWFCLIFLRWMYLNICIGILLLLEKSEFTANLHRESLYMCLDNDAFLPTWNTLVPAHKGRHCWVSAKHSENNWFKARATRCLKHIKRNRVALKINFETKN